MAVEYCSRAANLKLSERHGLRLWSQRESTVGGTQVALIAALAATTQAVFAQHGDFAPKVQVIIDYLKNADDECVSPALPG
jgi:hypothetical protein